MMESVWLYGEINTEYGIWDSTKKEFVFGIREPTPMLAKGRLFHKIGENARKWRYEIKKFPKNNKYNK